MIIKDEFAYSTVFFMKRTNDFVILIYIMALFSACGHGRYSTGLVMADSLASTSPDKARPIIARLAKDTVDMKKSELMYYKLIRLKADIKGVVKQTSDIEAKSLLSYYEHCDDKSLLPQVYYYVAGVYRDMNDAPQALDYYQKSIDAMTIDNDLKLKSYAYNQMGKLFMFQGLDKLAFQNFYASYKIDSLRCDTTDMVWSLVDMSVSNEKKDVDRCIAFLNKAKQLTKQSKLDLNYAIENRLSVLFYEKCQYDSAWVYLKSSFRRKSYIDSSVVYSIAARIFMAKGQLDSAKYYNQELIRMGTVYAKSHAAKSLAIIAFKENKPAIGFNYIGQYELYSDSVEKIDSKQAVVNASALYNYQLRERENTSLKKTQRRSTVLFMTFTLVGFIVMLILAYKNIKAKQIQEQMELKMLLMEKKTDELEAQSKSEIERRKKEIDRLTDELLDTQKDKNEIERQLEEEKAKLGEAMMNRQRAMERKMEVDNELQATKAVGLAKSKLKLQKHLTRAEWTEVEDELEELLGDFRVFLYNAYELSEQEYHICLLIKLGFKNNEIGTLTSREPNAISLARKRLYKKLTGSDGSAADLDLFVRGL